MEYDQTYRQDVVKDVADNDLDGGPKEVEYASVDFSLMKRRSQTEAAEKQETTETEYAEIKKECKEEEGLIGEDEKTEYCVPEEDEGEDMAVYSTVKQKTDEI